MKHFLHTKKAKGFSIGEVLLAVFILTVGVVAAVQLTQKNVSQTAASRNAIIATQLAQEGVELVRNARDNNAAWRYYDKQKNVTPLRDIFAGFFVGNACGIDYKSYYSDILGLTCSNSFGLIKGNNPSGADGFYESTSATAQYHRRIVLALAPPNTAYTVTSIVTWDGTTPPTNVGDCSLAVHCVFAENVLTSWIAVE